MIKSFFILTIYNYLRKIQKESGVSNYLTVLAIKPLRLGVYKFI